MKKIWLEKDAFNGQRTERPQLIKALNYCNDNDATLIVAKLDRLSRDAEVTKALNKSDITTRGGGKWFTTQVYRVSRRHKL